ncbi:hypothetical protein ACSQ67_023979 [Phaseolus vulgaris]
MFTWIPPSKPGSLTMCGCNSTTTLLVGIPVATRTASSVLGTGGAQAERRNCFGSVDFYDNCWKWVCSFDVLTSRVLPAIKSSSKYGGVMLVGKIQ